MDRSQLADFLRNRRARVTPADVGLPAGTRRRTPGLRREEVAQLAFISTEYYARLEQARGPIPSREVLTGLARALRLTDAERLHLYELAGTRPAPPTGPHREVRRSILDLIARLPDTAAVVTSATLDILAWNELACALITDFSAVPIKERNFARQAFLDGPHLYEASDRAEFRVHATRELRAAAARYPHDTSVWTLIDDLRRGSAAFEALWTAHDIAAQPTLRKTFHHREVGPVTVNCDALDIPECDQRVILYTATPGSRDEELLRLVSVIGTQRLHAPT